MNSKYFENEKFSAWNPFEPENFDPKNKDKSQKISGVYVIKIDEEICRLYGSSDIVKIGETKNINKRIWRYLKPFDTEKLKNKKNKQTAYRIRKAYEDLNYKFQVAWKKKSGRGNRKKYEIELLDKYLYEHYELPPLNMKRG